VVVIVTRVLTGAFTLALLASSAALAQDAAAPAAPAAPPRPDVKAVGDWFVRCYPVQSPSPCDVFQEQDAQATRQRILSLSFAYVPSADRHMMQITVPLDIAIPKGVVIQTDSYTSPALHYRMCNRDGCFVQMAMENSAVEAIAKSGPDAKINIVGDDGKSYALKFSLKGFASAHDDMVAQARAKAKAPAKPADTAAPAAPAATP
jgi:invasion protein IalB